MISRLIHLLVFVRSSRILLRADSALSLNYRHIGEKIGSTGKGLCRRIPFAHRL